MVCPATNTLWQDALGSAKDNGSPINGLPFLLLLFHQSLYLLTFDVFWLFHKKKNCGQMVLALASDQRSSGSARYLLLCLKAHSAFPAKLQHKVKPLVQVCQLLEFLPGVLRVLHQRSINQIPDLSSLIDVKSLEALASVKPCINDMPIHSL